MDARTVPAVWSRHVLPADGLKSICVICAASNMHEAHAAHVNISTRRGSTSSLQWTTERDAPIQHFAELSGARARCRHSRLKPEADIDDLRVDSLCKADGDSPPLMTDFDTRARHWSAEQVQRARHTTETCVPRRHTQCTRTISRGRVHLQVRQTFTPSRRTRRM